MCVVLFCFYSELMCCCVWRNKDTHNWPRSVCCGTNRASQHVLTGPSSKSTARSSPMSRSLTIWRASRSKRRLIHCSGCDGQIPLIFCSPQTVHLQLLLVFFHPLLWVLTKVVCMWNISSSFFAFLPGEHSCSVFSSVLKQIKQRILSCVVCVPSVLWRCWLGGRKGIRPVKNWLVEYWHGYLSGASCRLAYGPADATATHCLLLQ